MITLIWFPELMHEILRLTFVVTFRYKDCNNTFRLTASIRRHSKKSILILSNWRIINILLSSKIVSRWTEFTYQFGNREKWMRTFAQYHLFVCTIENESRAFVSPRFSTARTQIRGIIKSHDSTGRPRRIVYLARCHGQIIQSRRTRRLLMSVAVSPLPFIHSLYTGVPWNRLEALRTPVLSQRSNVSSIEGICQKYNALFNTFFSPSTRPFSRPRRRTLIENTPEIKGVFSRTERGRRRRNDTKKEHDIWVLSFFEFFFLISHGEKFFVQIPLIQQI